MIKTIEKYPIAAFSVAIICMLLVHLDIPNVTIMEARNFITAREMLTENHWILTTMNGIARYQKPPLPTWLSAISAFIFGSKSLFALRLPSALMVLFSMVFTYHFSLKLNLSKSNSIQNSFILMTSFYIVGIINEAPWDIYAHGFMLAGIYYLFQLFQNNNNLWKSAIWFGVFMGLSAMSKGPISMFGMLIPFIISYSIVFKYHSFKNKIAPLITSLILFLIIGFWWFIYVRFADAPAFLKIAAKETGNWSSYNVKPFYYYWSFFIQSGIWTIPAFISLLYPYLKDKVSNKKTYKLTLYWTLIAVVLLSLIPEKKPRYLVPVLFPLAFNIGFYIEYLILNFTLLKNKKETIPVYFNFILISMIALVLPILIYFKLNNAVTAHFASYLITSIAAITIGIFIVKNLFQKKFKNVFYGTIFFMISMLTFGLPMAKSLNNNPKFNAVNSISEFEAKEQIKTYSIDDVAPEILWNFQTVIPNIYSNNIIKYPQESKFGLLISENNAKELLPQINKIYNSKLIETIDLNPRSKRKDRLISQFYLILKK